MHVDLANKCYSVVFNSVLKGLNLITTLCAYCIVFVFIPRLKYGTYYVTGSGLLQSVCPQTFSFPANSSCCLHTIKLKLGL